MSTVLLEDSANEQIWNSVFRTKHDQANVALLLASRELALFTGHIFFLTRRLVFYRIPRCTLC
jgi:hypothetical protein